jgi:hypothetical protein
VKKVWNNIPDYIENGHVSWRGTRRSHRVSR